MKARTKLARCCLVACAFGALALHAQDSAISTAFKIRGLFSKPGTDQGLTNNVIGRNLELGLGFGLEVGLQVGPGKITAEAGYDFLTGDQYLADTSGMAKVDGTTTIDPTKSVESRKNKVEGMLVRFGYEAPVNDALTWRAGIQIGGNIYTHQVIGNIVGTDGAAKYADTYWYNGTKSNYMPSPYGALNFKIDDTSSIEVGLLLLQYKALNYQHVANTSNASDTIVQSNKILPNIEVAYVFHF